MSHDWRNPERVVPWKPRQQFRLTGLGQGAIERYHEVIEAAQQSSEPRTALERAKTEWAEALKLRPADGILLEDLAVGRSSLAEMQETLEACGLTLRDARGTLDRLLAAGLVETGGGPGLGSRIGDTGSRP